MTRKIIDFVTVQTLGTAGNVQLTAAQLLGGVLIRDCAGAARTDTPPSGPQIIDYLTISGRAPVIGNAVEFYVRNTSAGAFAVTIGPGPGIINAGTMIVPQNQQGRFLAVVGASNVVTIMGMGVSAY
jgi:hypothetical protein